MAPGYPAQKCLKIRLMRQLKFVQVKAGNIECWSTVWEGSLTTVLTLFYMDGHDTGGPNYMSLGGALCSEHLMWISKFCWHDLLELMAHCLTVVWQICMYPASKIETLHMNQNTVPAEEILGIESTLCYIGLWNNMVFYWAVLCRLKPKLIRYNLSVNHLSCLCRIQASPRHEAIGGFLLCQAWSRRSSGQSTFLHCT